MKEDASQLEAVLAALEGYLDLRCLLLEQAGLDANPHLFVVAELESWEIHIQNMCNMQNRYNL